MNPINWKELLISVLELVFTKLPGVSQSGSFLASEVRRLKAENISLKLELKILKGHDEILKKINDMSESDVVKFINAKGSRSK